MRMERDPVSLIAVVEAALETVRRGAEDKQITLRFEADPSVGKVVGDDDRLQQVVRNLLSNAVKFTPAGGKVSVSIRRADPSAEIVVSDTGPGIPAGFMPFVFDRFRQAESAITRTHGGLGLGLAIVRDIVELHGGTVSVASEGEGRGARFTVRLPLCAPGPVSRPDPMEVEATAGAACPPLMGIEALVVEDEPDSRDLISLILEQNGAKVVSTASAKDARAALTSARPDVIVSDIGMPVEDGYAFMSSLRALGPPLGSIPAVALTAYARTEDCRRALAVGFQAHVPKPIDAARLVAAVGRFVRGHAC
jgi:CheY-like chemotaxis protein/anti-sigma regulatory factor (Ser/Thr protein kinase)